MILHERFDAVEVLKTIERQKVTYIGAVPTMCERMLNGERAYVDIIETNPPVPILLYMPGALVAKFFGGTPEAATFAFAYASAFGSLWLAARILPNRLSDGVPAWLALAPIAQSLGYDVTVVDPRTAFASPERFPDVPLIAEWPDVALPPIGIDHYTAFVALTHDPEIDDPGLALALKSDCFYIGALGSRKTHARRVERLKAERGFTDNDIGRIHSPIGLDIGSVSPAEIAVAIIGEITQKLRQEPA